ncbi:MAG: formylglycine-generating enzyme family protein [Acetobacteraceae bacterium]|nr:formylglycine-generating enzyme family protein [Acetobacteraceae bacterium]
MTLTRDHLRRLVQVAHASDMGFVELVGLAELDPAEAFKGVTLRGLDLRNQDLAGFDFTGARLIECVLDGADLSRAAGIDAAVLAGAIMTQTTRLPFWASGRSPSWAKSWGRDTNGPWVTFRVPGTEIAQRMRWCPPGTFMMGSPEDEPGRYEDESPRHEVTLARGFWMFETACTKVLWEAVMGAPPSRRGDPTFPVTEISWDDARAFAERLNSALPGLGIGLPSEAQWEYACRAGTVTAYSFGDSITKDQVCFGSQGPIEVGTLPPNAWGLHEMHGNVWEWCEDVWHDDYQGAPLDGTARVQSDAARRVVQGGSWLFEARLARAACRYRYDPAYRSDGIGFRCARGHTASDENQAEPVALAKGR